MKFPSRQHGNKSCLHLLRLEWPYKRDVVCWIFPATAAGRVGEHSVLAFFFEVSFFKGSELVRFRIRVRVAD
jgi:hypothetical protein